MKKVLLFLTIFLIGATLLIHPAEAHFLATDGSIGAVLHVDPNDDPIAGSQASFFFEFKDKQNKFTPRQCDCIFEIAENGNTIFSQPLFQNNSTPTLSNASVFYTFPQRDVYQVIVVGKPTTANAFQPFTLTWNFRIDQQVTPQAASGQNTNTFFTTHLVHFIGLGIMLFFFLLYIGYTVLQKRKPPMKGGDTKDDKKDISNMF